MENIIETEGLHRDLDQYKDIETAQDINRVLIEIEQAAPGELQRILIQLKLVLQVKRREKIMSSPIEESLAG